MKLIEQIASANALGEAAKAVKRNKGAAGVDRMEAAEAEVFITEHGDEIGEAILNMKYEPQPVRRVYIPKADGKQRPLGIPVVVDRIVQQAAALVLSPLFEKEFSNSSYGFRPGRSAHDAVKQALVYMNEGYTWVIDLDIEKFFDCVNHDKLISIIRTKVNEKEVLHLIRSFLKADIMEEGKITESVLGTPQGGCISPLLANIYLDVLDKELEARGLRFCRYADDVVIFVKSRNAAKRVMHSIADWLERKLFLKVSPTKTKVVRPNDSTFLGFTFIYRYQEKCWKPVPAKDRKKRLEAKIKEILCRRRAAAKPLSETFTKLNQVIRGWVNYFHIGMTKTYLKEKLGPWMRHKVRVVILKQWKRPRTIFKNLMKLNEKFRCRFSKEEIRQIANSRLGLYKTAGWKGFNFMLSPKVLGMKNGDRPGLIDPHKLYCSLNHINDC